MYGPAEKQLDCPGVYGQVWELDVKRSSKQPPHVCSCQDDECGLP